MTSITDSPKRTRTGTGGGDTFAGVGAAVEAREIDWIRVKGRAQPVAIYEVAALAGALPPARRAVFEGYRDGLERFRAREFPESRAAFERALERDPNDGPLRTFLRRLEQYDQAPPGPEWDGVFSMTTK